MKSYYNVKCSSFIPLKYYYYPPKSPSTLMHSSDISVGLKIPWWQNCGSAPTFTTMQQQLFLLAHHYRFSDF